MPRPTLVTPKQLRSELSGPGLGEHLLALIDENDVETAAEARQLVDAELREIILEEQAVLETELKLKLFQTRIVSRPVDAGLIRSTSNTEGDYDVVDDPYDLLRIQWQGPGEIKLRWRPVLSVERVALRFGTQAPNVWREFDGGMINHRSRLGIIHVMSIFTRGSSSTQPIVLPHFNMAFINGGTVPGVLAIDYTAGMVPRNFNVMTDNIDDAAPDFPIRALVKLIRLRAAASVLSKVVDALGAGGGSIAMEGLSESYDSSQIARRQQAYEISIAAALKPVMRELKPISVFMR